MTDFQALLRTALNPFVAFAVSACVLIGTTALMIESRAAILRNGKEIVLKAEPIDPRDLLRGDYVRLSYSGISAVDTKLVVGGWPPGDITTPVWLVLGPDADGHHVAKAVMFMAPDTLTGGEVVLKSLPMRINMARLSAGLNPRLRPKFGIERYYVPEGEGLEIETARNQGRTSVAIRVSDAGNAQIARLMIDGEMLYSEPLY